MKNYEHVTVSLGVPTEPGGPMPATVFDTRQRRIRFQYLSPSQRAAMGADTSATWLAEYVPGWENVPARWDLKERTDQQ